jgi:hypothetical protein
MRLRCRLLAEALARRNAGPSVVAWATDAGGVPQTPASVLIVAAKWTGNRGRHPVI